MMQKIQKILLFALLASLLLAACGQKAVPPTEPTVSGKPTAGSEPVELRVMTHCTTFMVSEALITQFEQANNVKITFLKSGDTGAALNKAILSKDAPLADVFYGVDNTFLSRALDAKLFKFMLLRC